MRLIVPALSLAVLHAVLLHAYSAEVPDLEVYEGNSISLPFAGILKSSRSFGIFFNNDKIFEDRNAVEGSLPPEQLERMKLQVLKVDNDTVNVQLDIGNAAKGDGGMYRLEGLSSEDNTIVDSISLLVFYAPRDPQCTAVNNTLRCTASKGYPAGEIICYQGGQKLVPQNATTGNNQDELAAWFLFNSSAAIGCCAASRTFPVQPEVCSDSAAYPRTEQPTASPDLDNTTSQNTTLQSTRGPSNAKDGIFYGTIAIICFICFVTIVLYPFGMIYHFAIQMRSPTKSKYESQRQGQFTRAPFNSEL